MVTYDLLQHLDACNLLKPLLKSGMLSPGVLKKRDIYQYYDKEIRIGTKKPDAITFTADAFKISENYVYQIINSMEYQCGLGA